MKDRLLRLLMKIGMFLLRGAGWASVGVFVGFIASYFFRLPGRVDVFSLTETLLGVVITGLSIVGAFMVALQWGNLESKMHTFDVKVKETNIFFDKGTQMLQDLSEKAQAQIDSTIDKYEGGIEYLQKLLDDNAKTANTINSKIEEYKEIYVKKEEEFEKRKKNFEEELIRFDEKQKEFAKILGQYKQIAQVDKQQEENSHV